MGIRFLVVLVGALVLALFLGTVALAQQDQYERRDGTVAQQQRTAPESTSNITADESTIDTNVNRPNSGSFRCDLFLRSVSDDTGALSAQYRRDEAIVQRFEQCLSEDVLANTIPDRSLPFTGGMPLLLLAAIGLAAIVAGASVLRAVTRRGR